MKNKRQTRTEIDTLGEVEVPKDAFYGAFTVRAHSNFQISDLQAPGAFRQGLGIVKLAAARANGGLKLLAKKQQNAIEKAAQEFIDGKFNDQFTLDVFQAGAGTSYNMNANEVIANRANQILKSPKGKYKQVHPNNHVNMAQSTNDVIPTATRIAALLMLPPLMQEAEKLEKALTKIARKHRKTLKVGRTHLQDAVPVTLGQEIDSYVQALRKSREFIKKQSADLRILGIGGTAAGTGINTDPKYRSKIVQAISQITKTRFKSAKNLGEIANNMNSFMNFHAALRSFSTNLLNLAGNLKLMNMGPKAGLAEITLPSVQPGSSIMPGKINPSIPEAVEMVCLQVAGNDTTIQLACGQGQFQLNVMCPIIMHNLLQSMQILTGASATLRRLALTNLKINTDKIQSEYENSLCTATALAPYIGYNQTSDVVKTALKKGISIREEVLARKLLTEKQLKKLLSPALTTRPSKKIKF